MNERIQELARQARKNSARPGVYMEEEFYEKFAELIVKECADRIKNTTFLGDTKEWFEPDDVLWTAAQQVKEHFGVEV